MFGRNHTPTARDTPLADFATDLDFSTRITCLELDALDSAGPSEECPPLSAVGGDSKVELT